MSRFLQLQLKILKKIQVEYARICLKISAQEVKSEKKEGSMTFGLYRVPSPF